MKTYLVDQIKLDTLNRLLNILPEAQAKYNEVVRFEHHTASDCDFLQCVQSMLKTMERVKDDSTFYESINAERGCAESAERKVIRALDIEVDKSVSFAAELWHRVLGYLTRLEAMLDKVEDT